MTTSTPLALALVIGTIGGILLTLVLGTARITQLRRQVHRPKGDSLSFPRIVEDSSVRFGRRTL